MAEELFKIYTTIQLWATKYRNYKLTSSIYNFENFRRQIHLDEYVQIEYVDDEKPIIIILFKINSKKITKKQEFRSLINKFRKKHIVAYFFTADYLSSFIKTKLLKEPEYSTIISHNFLHKHFTHEIPLGPFVPVHTILTPQQTNQVCVNELNVHPLSLPSISVMDPQNQWIGAKIGQTIKLEGKSPISGIYIKYNIVSKETERSETYTEEEDIELGVEKKSLLRR